jgi:tetraacyldisaccharide 4'-kinase
VIVVGNIVVGGAGKTPVVQAVVRCLQQAGYRPGIVSRGYPVSPKTPRSVSVRSIPADVGDEPTLHFALGVPVEVCADRVAAAMSLLTKNPEVNVIVADDAMQHYALLDAGVADTFGRLQRRQSPRYAPQIGRTLCAR